MEAEHYSFFAEAPTEAIQSAIPITERFIMRYSRIAVSYTHLTRLHAVSNLSFLDDCIATRKICSIEVNE